MAHSLLRTFLVSKPSLQSLSSNNAILGKGIQTPLYVVNVKKMFTPITHPVPFEDNDEHEHESDEDFPHFPHPVIPMPKYSFKSVFHRQTYLTTPVCRSPYTKVDFLAIRRPYSTNAHEKKKVAVVLSGSGVHDGSEIQESVSILVHLSRAGYEAKCFAPDMPQSDVINHVKGAATDESRNVLVESARISRGKIKPLSQLQHENYSALIFPGGYGAAKNLCTFAKEGENCSVQPDVSRVIKAFHKAKKAYRILLCVTSNCGERDTWSESNARK